MAVFPTKAPLKMHEIGGGDLGLSYGNSEHPFCLIPIIHPDITEKGQRRMAYTIKYRMELFNEMEETLAQAYKVLLPHAKYLSAYSIGGEEHAIPKNSEAQVARTIEGLLKAIDARRAEISKAHLD